jgi:hypothetical protein
MKSNLITLVLPSLVYAKSIMAPESFMCWVDLQEVCVCVLRYDCYFYT